MNLGFELEFTGITRLEFVHALEKLFQHEAQALVSKTTDDGYIYYKIEDNFGNIWRVLRDRSIKPQIYTHKVDSECTDVFAITDLVDEEKLYMVELVSPILTSKTLPVLFVIIDLIKSLGGIVNSSCGIHIHVDALPFEDTISLYKRFVLEQTDIYNAFKVEKQRLNSYCKPYNINFDLDNITTIDRFLYELCYHYDYVECVNKPVKECRKLRYHALNFYSLIRHGTIEYRLFNASLDRLEVANIIKWVLNFTYPHNQNNDMRLALESILVTELQND